MVQKNQRNVIKHTKTSILRRGATSVFYKGGDLFQTQIPHKLVRLCMKNGKKTKAHLIMAKTLTRLCEDTQMGSMDSIRFLTLAIDNVKPVLEVTKMRIAGSTQFVPKMIPQNRQESLAIRWLIEAAQAQKRRHATKKTGQTLTNNDGSHSVHSKTDLSSFLVLELIDAYNQVGSVKQKKDELHQLAEANRGFSHYRWW